MTTRQAISRKVNLDKLLNCNSNISKAYWIHAVKYGDYLDVRTYNNVKITFNGKNRDYTKRKQATKRVDSLSRSRQEIYRLIHANCFRHGQYRPIFTTYTFKEQCSSITFVNSLFDLFRRKLQRETGKRLQYLCVPEIQKEREKKEGVGVWHFHVIWFNLPWIDAKIHEELWSHGWCDIQAVRSIRDIGAYVAKYLSKDIMESRLYGKKTFYTSRGLIRPVDFFHKEEIDNIMNSCNTTVITRYEGPTFTQIKYKLS